MLLSYSKTSYWAKNWQHEKLLLLSPNINSIHRERHKAINVHENLTCLTDINQTGFSHFGSRPAPTGNSNIELISFTFEAARKLSTHLATSYAPLQRGRDRLEPSKCWLPSAMQGQVYLLQQKRLLLFTRFIFHPALRTHLSILGTVILKRKAFLFYCTVVNQ